MAQRADVAQRRVVDAVARTNSCVCRVNMRRRSLIILFITLCGVLLDGTAQSVTLYQGGAGAGGGGSVYKVLEDIRGTDKTLILELYAPWSHKSRWMHAELLRSQCLMDNDGYVVVSVDTGGEEGARLVQAYGVTDYPAIIVFNSSGDALSMMAGAMVAADFCSYLVGIRLQVDRVAVGEMSRIYGMVGKVEWGVLQRNVAEYLRQQPKEYLVLEEHFELFASPDITKYGTPAYCFLLENWCDFAVPSAAQEQIKRCVYELLIPMVTGVEEGSEVVLAEVAQDSILNEIMPEINEIIELINLRNENNARGYIHKLHSILDFLPQKYEYQVVTSLDFTATLLTQSDRESKRLARKILENLQQNTPSSAKNMMITEILDKF